MPFPTTIWRNVTGATHDPQLMAALVEQYYSAIRAYIGTLIRCPDNADDITQEFIQRRLLKGALLVRADQRRGRFRTYLKAALRNFVNDVLRTSGAIELRSDFKHAMVESSRIHLAERTLDREYCRKILQEAVQIVQQHCQDCGLHKQWRVLDSQVLRPATGCMSTDVELLRAELELESAQQIYSMKQTMLRMLKRDLESVLRANCVAPGDLPAEIDYILECVAPAEC